MMRLTIRHGDKFYGIWVSAEWAERHDNGRLISCGLTVGEDGFTARMFSLARRRFKTVEISAATYAHSGCLSRCKLRGDAICQW